MAIADYASLYDHQIQWSFPVSELEGAVLLEPHSQQVGNRNLLSRQDFEFMFYIFLKKGMPIDVCFVLGPFELKSTSAKSWVSGFDCVWNINKFAGAGPLNHQGH